MGSKKSSVVVIDKDVFKSKAWYTLRKGSSAVVYTYFLMKRVLIKVPTKRGKNRWKIANNGNIEFTYSEAKKYLGFTKPRFHGALKDLVERGLIDVTHSGGGFDGDKSLYGCSDRWRKYDTPEFEFKTIPKDNRQGRGFSAFHQKNQPIKVNESGIKPKLKRRKNKSK